MLLIVYYYMLVILLTDTGRVLYTYCDTASLHHLIDAAVSLILTRHCEILDSSASHADMLCA